MGNKQSSSSGKKYNGIAERADFSVHGPKHQPTEWWENEEHQYAVAACFINGVYVSEGDRQEGRTGECAVAPPWWESFGYGLVKELVNPEDDGIFGAVYQRTIHLDAPESAPFLVVAFRGMVTDCDRRTMLGMPGLNRSSAFRVALEAVHWVSLASSVSKVWLCGHSLGAAFALLLGKMKAKRGIYLDTFLFNPPIVLDNIGKGLVQLAGWINPGIAIASWMIEIAKREEATSDAGQQAFENLIQWEPRLLLHPGDFICSGYIKYFDERRRPDLLNAGRRWEELNLPYVTPSAFLIINVANKRQGECHGIKQWWDDDLILQYRRYGYPAFNDARGCLVLYNGPSV